VNLLAGRGLGLEWLLEAVPHQRGADVGVADVGHTRRAPEGHRRRRRRHRVASASLPPLLAPPQVGGWIENRNVGKLLTDVWASNRAVDSFVGIKSSGPLSR